jgi:hypothetical protein
MTINNLGVEVEDADDIVRGIGNLPPTSSCASRPLRLQCDVDGLVRYCRKLTFDEGPANDALVLLYRLPRGPGQLLDGDHANLNGGKWLI